MLRVASHDGWVRTRISLSRDGSESTLGRDNGSNTVLRSGLRRRSILAHGDWFRNCSNRHDPCRLFRGVPVGQGSRAKHGSQNREFVLRACFAVDKTDWVQAQWNSELAAGLLESSQYPELSYTPCIDGLATAIPGDANNTFQCNNVSVTNEYSGTYYGTNSPLTIIRSTCTTSSHMQTSEAPRALGPPRGDGHPRTAANSLRSASTTEQPLRRSPPRASWSILEDSRNTTPSARGGERSGPSAT